ncbi:MAG: transposase [Phycisphaeraceae bacterium]|nr:transposase [Phycisphaeraceae bacterium]
MAQKLELLRLDEGSGARTSACWRRCRGHVVPGSTGRSLRTNNPLERLNREIRRRTRVVGFSRTGQSGAMLVAARLRHMSATKWGLRRYMDMSRLRELDASRAESSAAAA